MERAGAFSNFNTESHSTLTVSWKRQLALDAIAFISARLSDLHFEQNNIEAIERCRQHMRHIYRYLPTFVEAVSTARHTDTKELLIEAMKPCTKALWELRSANSEYQHTTQADDQALVEEWTSHFNFALQCVVLDDIEAAQLGLSEIEKSARQQHRQIFQS